MLKIYLLKNHCSLKILLYWKNCPFFASKTKFLAAFKSSWTWGCPLYSMAMGTLWQGDSFHRCGSPVGWSGGGKTIVETLMWVSEPFSHELRLLYPCRWVWSLLSLASNFPSHLELLWILPLRSYLMLFPLAANWSRGEAWMHVSNIRESFHSWFQRYILWFFYSRSGLL